MANVHGKATYVSLGGVDISTYTNNTDWDQEADEHDVTTYHPTRKGHVFGGGLLGGKTSIGGLYDNTTSGPHDSIRPLLGTIASFVFRVEGTGTGKPQDTVDVLVKSYKESVPVADMVMWTAELTLSGDVTSINQP